MITTTLRSVLGRWVASRIVSKRIQIFSFFFLLFFLNNLPTSKKTNGPHLAPGEARCYLDRYNDLKAKFGDDSKLAAKHWREVGFRENRIATCSPQIADFNKRFVKSGASAVYYLQDYVRYHVPSCRPCGPKRSVCDGSLPVEIMAQAELDKSPVESKLFSCEKMAPALWEGNIFVQHREPLNLKIDERSQTYINILMCGMGRDFTGGPLSIMHFANEMIVRGFNVRWVNVDGEGLEKRDFLSHADKYANLEAFVDKIDFVFGARRADARPLTVSPHDIFMATIYFTAQIAHFTASSYSDLRQKNFIYFIQDFEPIFFPHDSNFIEAHEGYRFPHFAIYSTPFLEDWFLRMKFGQSAFVNDGPNASAAIREISFAAEPAMKSWPLPSHDVISDSNRVRKVIVYARAHADRNAYGLTIDSLSTAICKDVFPGKWQFIGVGSLDNYTVLLGNHCGKRVIMNVTQNIPEPQYLSLLRTGDIGFSLMISPHPSLPPLDFSAAGLVAVTNSFATKTLDSFLRVSSNFVVTEPYIDAIVDGLRRAVANSRNSSFRISGAQNFRWERKWNGPKCYGKPLANKLQHWLSLGTTLW